MSPETLPFPLTVLELCTGGGGQALGLEMAGFECVGAIDNDFHACETLRRRIGPDWQRPPSSELKTASGSEFRGVDLLAAWCSVSAILELPANNSALSDERDLFPEALRVIEEANPGAIMLENVAGFASF